MYVIWMLNLLGYFSVGNYHNLNMVKFTDMSELLFFDTFLFKIISRIENLL